MDGCHANSRKPRAFDSSFKRRRRHVRKPCTGMLQDTRISTRRDLSYVESLFQRPPKAPVRTRVGQVSKRGKMTRR